MTKKEKERLKNASNIFFAKLLNKEFEELDFFGRKVTSIKITKEEYEVLEPFFHAWWKAEYKIGEIGIKVDGGYVAGNTMFITNPNEIEEVYVEVSDDIVQRSRMLVNLYDLIDMCSSGPREIPYKYIHPDAKG